METVTSWRERAACRGMDPAIFFIAESRPQAKRLCRGCDVREECLDYALTTYQPYGVWGGRSEYQRANMRRRQRSGGQSPIGLEPVPIWRGGAA